MGIVARELRPDEDPRYLDGPWSNAACRGYIIDAMKRCGYDDKAVAKVLAATSWSFDELTTREAKQVWYNW